jgi:TonB family protein
VFSEGRAYGDLVSRRRLSFSVLVSVVCHAFAVAALWHFSLGNSQPEASGTLPSLSVTLSAGDDSVTAEASSVTSMMPENKLDMPATVLAVVEQGAPEAGDFGVKGAKDNAVATDTNTKTESIAKQLAAPHYYSAESLGRRPIPLYPITPKYPADVEGVAGRVTLALLINEKGAVDGFRVVFSEPPGVFEQESIIAFKKAKYAPGLIGGVPVKAQFVVDIRFDPGEDPKVGVSM